MCRLFSKCGISFRKKTGRGRNVLWNSIGITAYNVTSPLFLIMVTRFGANGISDAGIFSLAYSSSIIFLAVSNYGMRAYQVTDAAGKYKSGQYSAARMITCAAAMIAAVVFTAMGRYELGKAAIFLLLAASKAVEGFSDVYYAMMQRQGRLDIAGKATFWKALLGMLTFSAIILFTRSILMACLSLVLIDFAFLFLYERKWAYRLDSPQALFSLSQVRSLLISCFPLFAVSVISLYLINIPRFAVDRFMTSADLGIYGILFMQATVVSLLTRFILQPSYTVFAERYSNQDRRSFLKAVAFVSGSIFAGAAVLLLFYSFCGAWLLRLLFGHDLSEYLPQLLIILGSSALNNCALVCFTALTAMRVMKVQLYIALADVALGLAIASPLVARWGIQGAVATFAAVSVFQFAAAVVVFFLKVRGMEPDPLRP